MRRGVVFFSILFLVAPIAAQDDAASVAPSSDKAITHGQFARLVIQATETYHGDPPAGDLALEQLKQRKCIGRTAGEASDYAATGELPHLAGIAFHHGVAHADLAVTADGDNAITAY